MIKKLCRKLIEATGKVGLIINDEKTEYMKLCRRDRMIQHGKSLVVEIHTSSTEYYPVFWSSLNPRQRIKSRDIKKNI